MRFEPPDVSSTSGVSTRQIVSLTRKAEKTPATSTMAASRIERMARARHDQAVDQPEEAGEAEVGHDDHHPEEEHDGLDVDGGVGLVEA